MINVSISKKVFNDKYIPYLDNEDRYLLFYGGGSSGKSYYIVQRYIYRLLKKKMNLLVVRQTGNTNRNSTFALFKQVIKQWNLSQQFKINESDLRIKCVNGNEIIFSGLDDTEKLKSVTFESGELTDIWVEEATETLEEDINQLKVRLRGGKSKKQMVLSFNPINISHWIKRHFIDSGLATVCHSTYKDNKFLTDEDRKTLESFKDTDLYYYQVYCLGEWGVLGKTFFNAENITKRISQLKEPIKVGSFIYDYNGLNITNIRWKNEQDGFIKIYEAPKKNYPYVLSGDTAGEGSDYFIGQVLDNTNGKQIATLRKEFDADEYTRQMYCLAKYYNNALVGIESNFDTFPIKEIERIGYKKQYVRMKEDSYTGKTVKAYGFRTDRITRPLILSELQAIINDHVELINDKDTLEEMLVFVRNEKGRPEAQDGCHDDLVMALAIAFHIREQQEMTVKQDNHELEYNIMKDFGFEREVEGDFGSRIEVF
jgi:phage terminase large subunit